MRPRQNRRRCPIAFGPASFPRRRRPIHLWTATRLAELTHAIIRASHASWSSSWECVAIRPVWRPVSPDGSPDDGPDGRRRRWWLVQDSCHLTRLMGGLCRLCAGRRQDDPRAPLPRAPFRGNGRGPARTCRPGRRSRRRGRRWNATPTAGTRPPPASLRRDSRRMHDRARLAIVCQQLRAIGRFRKPPTLYRASEHTAIDRSGIALDHRSVCSLRFESPSAGFASIR
jgi:hypothetical protein